VTARCVPAPLASTATVRNALVSMLHLQPDHMRHLQSGRRRVHTVIGASVLIMFILCSVI